jgi:putative redox protein
MKKKRIRFKGGQDYYLGAQLDLPEAVEPLAYALFAHCFTCNKNLKAVNHITTALCEEGIAVLRFDFTGLGESEGDFADTNFSSNIDDLIAASRFLSEQYQPPHILIGHSLGGAAVLQAARFMDSVRAAATIGAPFDPGHVTRLFQNSREEIERKGEATVKLAGRSFQIKKQFLDDLDQKNMEKVIRELRRSLLIFHSPLDNTVGIDNAAEIFTAARHPKSFISLDQADHLLTRQEDSLYVGKMVATWAEKYIRE